MFGLSAIGLRAWDVVRSIDFLETLPFVDKDHIGCMGNSGGGMTTTFASAVDERIRAAIISGYFCSWWYSIISLAHCPCNYMAHLMEHFTVADIVAMRAPQPTFVVSGELDHIFPQAGVQEAYKLAQQAYSLAGAPDNLGIHVMPKTYHRFSGEKSYPWLETQLKPNASEAGRE
jgi:dienelactone hydrolase